MKFKLQTAHRDARETLVRKKEHRKDQYDAYHKVKETDYRPGNLVLLRNENRKKLDTIYNGPYEIICQKGVNCELKYNGKTMVVHKNLIKPFYVYLTHLTERSKGYKII